MTITELNELIFNKTGVHAYVDGTMNALRFLYQGNTYRVNTDLFVEKVEGACLVSDSDTQQLEKLLRTERDKAILQMFSIIDSSDVGSIYLAENLYDAIVAGKIDGLGKVG